MNNKLIVIALFLTLSLCLKKLDIPGHKKHLYARTQVQSTDRCTENIDNYNDFVASGITLSDILTGTSWDDPYFSHDDDAL